jgi:hypothetical protein
MTILNLTYYKNVPFQDASNYKQIKIDLWLKLKHGLAKSDLITKYTYMRLPNKVTIQSTCIIRT